MIVDQSLDAAQLVYVTPSHQVPTSVTMSLSRRQSLLARASERDQLIIEDDSEFENIYVGQPHPALRGMDTEDRVIYVSCLSKVLDSGLCMGFIVAAPEIISEARKLRRLTVNHPPPNNQRAAAYFLSLGHYDSFMMHMHRRFGERWKALLEALHLYLLHFVKSTRTHGGTSVWIQGPAEIEMSLLVQEAAKRGILIEPVAHYYASLDHANNYFRMGITSIPLERIREGVERLSELIHELTSDRFENLAEARGRRLAPDEISEVFSGATVFWKTINGDPATIDYLADGQAEGRIGYANEDRGKGSWWVEGDLWFRKWERWYFGEPLGFHVVLDGLTIKLFEEDGQLSDIGVLHKPAPHSEDADENHLD
jgi:GntR family transcriptional regulator/MocR family aminotransferase